jgi:catechol 2,3-dioxygenase-like lactoylglutathione lyase family enzyme
MVALRVAGVSLDCADPDELGSFYQRLLGGEILWANADSVGVRAAHLVLVAQRVTPYTRPTWPNASVVHLDLAATPDLDTATATAVRHGATLLQPQHDPRWNVLVDPAGHPFCITTVTSD